MFLWSLLYAPPWVSILCGVPWFLYYTSPLVFTLCDALGSLRYAMPLRLLRYAMPIGLYIIRRPLVFTLCATPPLCSNALFYVGIGKVAVLAFCLVAVGFL